MIACLVSQLENVASNSLDIVPSWPGFWMSFRALYGRFNYSSTTILSNSLIQIQLILVSIRFFPFVLLLTTAFAQEKARDFILDSL